ncbi:hypothetical protein LguiB_005406 [Lonicera macranthoides]
MEDKAGQQGRDQRVTSISTTVDRSVVPPNLTEQPISPKDERIVSTNPYPDAAITGPPSRILADQQPQQTFDPTSGAFTTAIPLNAYSPQEQSFYFGASGYDNGTGQWGDYSNYVNANNLQIVPPQAMYNDNQSLPFHSGYGFDTQMAYGQFSPLPSPPIMLDGQLYSPQQFQVSPYFTQPVSPSLPHVTSAHSISQTDLMMPGNNSGQEGLNDSVLLGPGSGYYVHYGSFDGGNSSGNSSLGFYNFQGEFGSGEQFSNRPNSSDVGSYFSPLTSGAVYPHQPVGILGSYENNFRQTSQQQTPYHGFGYASNSSTRRYPHNGSYNRTSNYNTGGSISNWEASRTNRFQPDKGVKQERDRDPTTNSIDSHGGASSDRNRGPRASKPKAKNTSEENSETGVGTNGGSSSSGVIPLGLYNRLDFVTDYENAKFFVIKSFSEDNVHKSIKYNIWASTPLGNRKLDAAYQEAKEMKGNCPIFLFFSVNASGQFCGVAEMIGSVDFENNANYWQQDRWSGQFPVKWHIIKDVPNSRFRHILLENNDNKPVTHSRDSQEVKLEEGIEMLKIFKEHEADTSIVDDFEFYNEREKVLHEKKARQLSALAKNSPQMINQLSDNLAESLRLESNKQVQKTE